MSEYLDPSEEIQRHGSKLPHWQQSEAMQFVTFRLGDAMPASALRAWREQHEVWKLNHPQLWEPEVEKDYHRRFTRKLEYLLDEGEGVCLLKDPDARAVFEQTLMRDHGSRAIHHAWVIMPNHAHLLLTAKAPLEALIRTWKGVSARRIGHGPIWQKGYRDTLIRDSRHFANAVRYIRRNPVNLVEGTYTLWQSDRALDIS